MLKSISLVVVILAGGPGVRAVLAAGDANVLDFGAVPDGKTLCTEAIQRAIDRCASEGGGTVLVPPGTFLTRTVFLKSRVELHLRQGAVLRGDTDPRAFKGAVVYAEDVSNASITGPGAIDGQGFKKFYPTGGPRHHNILFHRCRDMTVRDVTLLNAPSWVFRIRRCVGVRVRGIRIYSFANENNDGIDIDGRDIVISDCRIDCDDDAVCLKSDDRDFVVEDVTISNCVIASNCNAIKFGTASHGGFRNVVIGNCAIRRPSEAAHRQWTKIRGVTSDDTGISGIALEVVDGGIMDQVAVHDIVMTGVQTPVFVRLGSRRGRGVLKNILVGGILATSESLIPSSVTGIPGSYVENLVFRDFQITVKGTGTEKDAAAAVPEREDAYPENRMFGPSLPAYGLYVRHAKGIGLRNLRFRPAAPDARPAVVMEDVHDAAVEDLDATGPSGDQPLLRLVGSTRVRISGCRPGGEVRKFLRVEGDTSREIDLDGNDFSRVPVPFELKEGVPAGAVRERNSSR